jgi:acyl-CoA synthetase (AMP-forming)/AMP-acid ligase II
MPDEVLGEIGVAVVVAEPAAAPELDALRAHCSRTLSDYKAPDALVVVDGLPLTAMMKVDPGRLAALAGQGVEERRSRPGRNRGPASEVLGSGPIGEADEKERA